MNRTRTHRALAATAALAWLGLSAAVATDWPHHPDPAPAPAESSPTSTTHRVCWRDGTAALLTPMPNGQLLAVSDGTCTYTGPASSTDLEANR
jgi:hypothetical protein